MSIAKVSLCAPHELGESEVALWHRFQQEDARLANPFLSPEFAQVLGRHRADVRVAVIEEDARIVGFFPHHRSALGVGRGLAYGRGNGQGLVTAPCFEWDGMQILKRCGLNVWEFDYLPACQADRLRPRGAKSSPAYFIDLTPGWDGWLQAKRASSSTVRKALQNQRKLGRDIGEVSFSFQDQRTDGLRQLMQWKSEQYRRTGRRDLDHFAVPWFVSAVEELTVTSTSHFAGVMSVLSVDGRPVAGQQALWAHGVLSCWFTAYDRTLAAYSPGMACQLELVRAAFARGVREIDLAKGHAEYKDVLKNGERPFVEGWIERASPSATIRRVQQWPRRAAYGWVHAHPRSKRVATEVLRHLGGRRTVMPRP